MKKMEEIDKNFAVKSFVQREHTKIYNALHEPFSLHGLFPPAAPGETFYRFPRGVAQSVSESVAILNTQCTGGRIRFQTDSTRIAIYAVMGLVRKMSLFAMTGSVGFDLYAGREYVHSFVPKFDITDELFGEYTAEQPGMREYTINFPLYSEVKELYVILDEGATLQKAEPYKNAAPLVFYGSSITQGASASRPGTAYTSMVARDLGLDFWNFGFSGSARGERAMAEYLAGLDMCAFVMDYDHNATSAAELASTHEAFFQIVRRAHPHIPILCLTQPIPRNEDFEERKVVIRRTVDNAKAKGDQNVYYVDPALYLAQQGVLSEASVDHCHPNDLGFYFMARAVEQVLGPLV